MKKTIINLNQVKKNDNLVIRKLNDNYFFTIGGDAYEANEIGAIIVNAIGKDLSIDNLCERLSKKYSFDDCEKIKADVYEYLRFLYTERLLLDV